MSKLASRYAVHYGYKFEYTLNDAIKLPETQKIPEIFTEIMNKMIKDEIFKEKPNQLTINYYNKGDGK